MSRTPLPEDEKFATLLGLLQRYSPSGQEAGAVKWLVAHMRSLGYGQAFGDQAGNAVGVMGDGERQIVLLGHIDTVPGEIPLRCEAGLLHGRGAVDAKGPLAACVDAAARLGPLPGWQVIVIGAVDEERQSCGARHVAPRYQPDFAIIGEPSRWDRVTLGYKGSAWAQVRARRAVSHSASQAESASEAAFRCWSAIQDWAAAFNRDRERLFEQISPTLRGLASGEDGFEDWAELRVGARLPPGFGPQEWYQRLNQICQDAQVQPEGFPIRAYTAEKNTPLVRAFLSSIRSSGGRPGFVLKTGTSDLNLVAPAWGCPAVAYGPGDSSLDHTPNEHLALQEYSQAVDVLAGVLRRLSEQTGT